MKYTICRRIEGKTGLQYFSLRDGWTARHYSDVFDFDTEEELSCEYMEEIEKSRKNGFVCELVLDERPVFRFRFV